MKIIAVLFALCALTGLGEPGGNLRFSSTVVSVEVGGRVRLECRLLRPEGRYLMWGMASAHTRGVQRLLHWTPDSQTPVLEHNSSRIRGVREGRTFALEVDDVRQSDSAKYFCQFSDSLWDRDATDWCGCGSTLRVTTGCAPPTGVYLGVSLPILLKVLLLIPCLILCRRASEENQKEKKEGENVIEMKEKEKVDLDYQVPDTDASV